MTAAELKASILDQAIRGKLVPQDSSDEPAAELLKRIKAEPSTSSISPCQGKAKTTKSKKTAALPPITDEEKPFEIPESWEWCRLGEVCDGFQYGTAEKSNKVGQVPVLRMGNLKAGEIVYDNLLYTSNLVDIETYSLQEGDLLFNRTNSAEQVGKVAIFRGDRPCIYAGYLVRFRPILCSSEYFNFLMGSSYQRDFCFSVKTDAIQQSNISASKFARFPIPLPPLAEQKRIVEKIEELMPLVERYGKAEERRLKLNAALPTDLEKSILQEAIQGHLTAMWREETKVDESAAELLKRIKAEKAKLIAAKKIKKEKPLAPITDDEKPFDLPEGWEWCRLSEISLNIGTVGKQILAKDVQECGKYPVVSQGQSLIDGYCDCIEKLIDEGELILFGDHTRNVKHLTFPFVVGADGVKLFKPLVCGRWLYFWSLLSAEQIGSRGYGRHWALFNNYPIPLPPLAEQKVIVAKVEELLAAIKGLNAK